MNIVFLVFDIHYIGGAERVAINMANDFVRRNHQVTIVSLSGQKSSFCFPVDRLIHIDYLKFNFESLFNLFYKISSVFSVRGYLKRLQEPSVILGIGTYPSLVLSMIPGTTHHKTVGCPHNSFDFAKHVWFYLRSKFYHRLNAVVSLTREDLPRLKELNRNSLVIPNAVSFCPVRQAELKNKIILSIGRMDYYKGYDLLIEVFKKFSPSQPDWILRIIGEGPLKKQILARIEDSKLTDRIELVIPRSNIVDEYLNASVYVMNSRSEALPMVLLEAKACGLPVVSFDIKTGPSEIIRDGVDGFLVKPFEVDEMVDRLLELTGDDSKRRLFGINAREDAKRFSMEVIGKKWERMLEGLMING